MGERPLLVARDLHRSYGQGDRKVTALRGASMRLDAGELVVVRGRSGSGKTTFLNLLAGLDAPDEGEVTLMGHRFHEMGPSARLAVRASSVGFVFQDPALVPELRLWENVAMAARIGGVPASACRQRAERALATVGLAGLDERFPGEVSGGEAQRASVARALVKRPRLVLADEPTANLDHETARLVADVLRTFVTKRGAGAIVVTHDDIMASVGMRALDLRDGRLRTGAAP